MPVIVLLMAAAMQVGPLPADRGPPPAAPAASAADAEPQGDEAADVVVQGYRLRPDLSTIVVPPASGATIGIRQGYEWSGVLARCAARDRLGGARWLRAVVDGEFQTTRHAVAQDRLKRLYITCTEDPGQIASSTIPPAANRIAAAATGGGDTGGPTGNSNIPDVAPLGHSIYDRGAFTIEAMKRFAPDLTLTRAQTFDPQVQARFNEREGPRNRFRLPADYRYFEIAVCMVRVEPRLSVMLAMSDGPARFGDVQAALVDRARVCIGGARKVTIDPTEFRIYVAEAVYRWAVAARGVDSLIPADAMVAER